MKIQVWGQRLKTFKDKVLLESPKQNSDIRAGHPKSCMYLQARVPPNPYPAMLSLNPSSGWQLPLWPGGGGFTSPVCMRRHIASLAETLKLLPLLPVSICHPHPDQHSGRQLHVTTEIQMKTNQNQQFNARCTGGILRAWWSHVGTAAQNRILHHCITAVLLISSGLTPVPGRASWTLIPRAQKSQKDSSRILFYLTGGTF